MQNLSRRAFALCGPRRRVLKIDCLLNDPTPVVYKLAPSGSECEAQNCAPSNETNEMLQGEHGAVRRVVSLQLQPWIFSQQISSTGAVARSPRSGPLPKRPRDGLKDRRLETVPASARTASPDRVASVARCLFRLSEAGQRSMTSVADRLRRLRRIGAEPERALNGGLQLLEISDLEASEATMNW